MPLNNSADAILPPLHTLMNFVKAMDQNGEEFFNIKYIFPQIMSCTVKRRNFYWSKYATFNGKPNFRAKAQWQRTVRMDIVGSCDKRFSGIHRAENSELFVNDLLDA